MSATAIEWTDRTWNPVTGCTKVSPGCDHCYAEGIARRFAGTKAFPNGFEVTLHPERLDTPLRWRKPARVFVNSMSDLFHPSVPDSFILRVWEVMARTPRHTYQILTKRHGRMRSFSRRLAFATPTGEQRRMGITGRVPYLFTNGDDNWDQGAVTPLDNVWLGVSVEDQQRADLRIPALLDTPAAVRFLSCEPLLGPVDLFGKVDQYGGRPHLTYWLGGGPAWGDPETHPNGMVGRPLVHKPGVDWVIAGGESGPGARPVEPEWIRGLRDQCDYAGVPFLFKQWGGRTPKAGGRELDGRTWDEFPANATAVSQ